MLTIQVLNTINVKILYTMLSRDCPSHLLNAWLSVGYYRRITDELPTLEPYIKLDITFDIRERVTGQVSLPALFWRTYTEMAVV